VTGPHECYESTSSRTDSHVTHCLIALKSSRRKPPVAADLEPRLVTVRAVQAYCMYRLLSVLCLALPVAAVVAGMGS
jgi:hypothetical protein